EPGSRLAAASTGRAARCDGTGGQSGRTRPPAPARLSLGDDGCLSPTAPFPPAARRTDVGGDREQHACIRAGRVRVHAVDPVPERALPPTRAHFRETRLALGAAAPHHGRAARLVAADGVTARRHLRDAWPRAGEERDCLARL